MVTITCRPFKNLIKTNALINSKTWLIIQKMQRLTFQHIKQNDITIRQQIIIIQKESVIKTQIVIITLKWHKKE